MVREVGDHFPSLDRPASYRRVGQEVGEKEDLHCCQFPMRQKGRKIS